jgi:hypothetical protein
MFPYSYYKKCSLTYYVFNSFKCYNKCIYFNPYSYNAISPSLTNKKLLYKEEECLYFKAYITYKSIAIVITYINYLK